MALFKDYAERTVERETKLAEQKQAEAERLLAYKRADLAELGLTFDDYDDVQLEDAIKTNILAVSGIISEHEYGRSSEDALHEKGEMAIVEKADILIRQNWILIQQNERIARLLEKMR